MGCLRLLRRKTFHRSCCPYDLRLLLCLVLVVVCVAYHLHVWTRLELVRGHIPNRLRQQFRGYSSRGNTHVVIVNGGKFIKDGQNGRDLPVRREKGYPVNSSPQTRTILPSSGTATRGGKSVKSPCKVMKVVQFLGRRLSLEREPFCQWLQNTAILAEGRFILYDHQVALLHDVIVHPGSVLMRGPKGGEKMKDVMGQEESAEYFILKDGVFRLQCLTKPSVSFSGTTHLNQWLSAIQCVDNVSPIVTSSSEVRRVAGVAIAVQRYEYVNLYHTMTDLYNAFLTMLLFNQHPDNVTILWMDAHPYGGLDGVWSTLFGRVIRVGGLSSPLHIPALAWAASGYDSPLNNHYRDTVSYLEQFRWFFLSRHGVEEVDRYPNCSSLTFMFIWRRDYVAHPRNQAGTIQRKIDNEDELVEAARKATEKDDVVVGLQLDELSMKAQLRKVVGTDVLIGMHGAGLTHTLFLPPHAALIELFPMYLSQVNRHFWAMAEWRGLHYLTWQNENQELEKNNSRTYVPPHVVASMVKRARGSICG